MAILLFIFLSPPPIMGLRRMEDFVRLLSDAFEGPGTSPATVNDESVCGGLLDEDFSYGDK